MLIVVVNDDGATTDGIVTNGGFLNGTTHAVFTSGFTSTPDPTTFSFTADLTITTDKGILTLSAVGIFDVVNGVFTDISRVVGSESTGIFEGATGILFISGKTTDGINFEDVIIGEICFEEEEDD